MAEHKQEIDPLEIVRVIQEFGAQTTYMAREIIRLRRDIEGHLAFQRSVNEALNTGDGAYRP